MKKDHTHALVGLLFSLSVCSASAETITFRYTGAVTYGSPVGVPIGTKVTGTFAYDPHTAPGARLKNYASYQIQAAGAMTASFGDHKVSSDLLDIALMNNTASNVADIMDVSATAPMLDGTSLTNGTLGFRIASAYNHNDALKNTKLPKQINLDKFDAGPSMNVGVLQADGGPSGMLLEFSISTIEVVHHDK